MNVKQRVEKLEQAQDAGGGGFEIVGIGEYTWTEEQLEQAAAEARERVGPDGTVLVIEYTDQWRGPGGEK